MTLLEILGIILDSWQYRLFSTIVMLGGVVTIFSLLATIKSLTEERNQLITHLRAAYPVLTETVGGQKSDKDTD